MRLLKMVPRKDFLDVPINEGYPASGFLRCWSGCALSQELIHDGHNLPLPTKEGDVRDFACFKS